MLLVVAQVSGRRASRDAPPAAEVLADAPLLPAVERSERSSIAHTPVARTRSLAPSGGGTDNPTHVERPVAEPEAKESIAAGRALDARLADEPFDAPWALGREATLTAMLERAGFSRASISEVRCKTTLCRMVLRRTESDARADTERRLRGELGWEMSVIHDEREMRTAVYVARGDRSLAGDLLPVDWPTAPDGRPLPGADAPERLSGLDATAVVAPPTDEAGQPLRAPGPALAQTAPPDPAGVP